MPQINQTPPQFTTTTYQVQQPLLQTCPPAYTSTPVGINNTAYGAAAAAQGTLSVIASGEAAKDLIWEKPDLGNALIDYSAMNGNGLAQAIVLSNHSGECCQTLNSCTTECCETAAKIACCAPHLICKCLERCGPALCGLFGSLLDAIR